MLRFEKTVCINCGKTFTQVSGGVVASPYKECLCIECRKEKYKGVWNKICSKKC